MVRVAWQPDREGQTLAYQFYEKDQDTFERIAEYVDEAFDSQVKINEALEIHDRADTIPRLCRRMRFVGAPPPPEQLAEETEELIRKLFHECTRVEPETIQGGYSGVAICKFTPWDPRGRGETVIAKLGDAPLIEGDRRPARTVKHVQG